MQFADDSASPASEVRTVPDMKSSDRSPVNIQHERSDEKRVSPQATDLDVETLMGQLREANERLVMSSIRAQTLAEEAEQANRLKDEFLATLSHELRTPLNSLIGWARMLASEHLPPERTRHAVVVIERNAAALRRLIEDLLDTSRIMAGTFRIRAEPVNVLATTQAAIETVMPAATAKHIKLHLSAVPESAEPVPGDTIRLQQVVLNLLSNAIKFTPEGGRVDVVLKRDASGMQIAVADTGEGIAPEFLPHVFDRFRQADAATTRTHSGLGLGLAIVRELVELHGGTVEAESAGIGRGATFTVTIGGLPPTAPRERRSPPSTADQLHASLDNLRILVVEDDADARELTTIALQDAGATVTTVSSVPEALGILDVFHPDALVSDIGLPRDDGYSLIRQIRQREAEHGGLLPAVALTGYARAEDRAKTLAAGFHAHVPKPFDAAELTAAVMAVTRRHPSHGNRR
jgi:signal transduction histidine kinase/ActR/RegA family two-component response regulator